jgi:hypothetical protein
LRPKEISSLTARQTQHSGVTRATAAKPIPVTRQTTLRMIGTAAMLSIADVLAKIVFHSLPYRGPPVELIGRSGAACHQFTYWSR